MHITDFKRPQPIKIFASGNHAIKFLKEHGVVKPKETYAICDCEETVIAIEGRDKNNVNFKVAICDKCGYKPKRGSRKEKKANGSGKASKQPRLL